MTSDWLKIKTFVTESFDLIGTARDERRKMPVVLLADGYSYRGDATVALSQAERDVFWTFVEQHAVDAPAIPGLDREATWLPRGVRVRVKHLRGDWDRLRHATMIGFDLRPI